MNRHEKALEILKNGTVIPATPLALTKDRKFDEAHQRLLTRYYLEAGAGGIATAVHTTQFTIRDPKINLFDTILKVVVDEIEKYENETGRTVVRVAGACGPKEQAVAEAKRAKEYGFDAILLSPGGLGHLSEAELIERTAAVAEVMPVIGFYLQEKVGGRHLSYDYWEKVCATENVVAIKCASFNRYQTIDVVRAAAFSKRCDDITLYTGNDDNIVIDLLTKFNEKYHFLDTDSKAYRSAALEAADALLENKELVYEINTGAMSRGWRTTPYPADFILKYLVEKICHTKIPRICGDDEIER